MATDPIEIAKRYVELGDSYHDMEGTMADDKLTGALGLKAGTTSNSFVTALNGGNSFGTGLSFERKLEQWVENTVPHVSSLRKMPKHYNLTYDEIINGMKTNRVAFLAIYSGDYGVYDILQIKHDPGNKNPVSEFSDKDKNLIADFIIQFFFQGQVDLPVFTFDGKAGVIKKLFSKFSSASALITPQNIADPAPSSTQIFDRVSGNAPNRNLYFFPTNEGPEFKVTSNALTRVPLPPGQPSVDIRYTNNSYGGKNLYGFKYEVKIATNQTVAMSYSDRQNVGASIYYLCQI